jgi:hypothetical protein
MDVAPSQSRRCCRRSPVRCWCPGRQRRHVAEPFGAGSPVRTECGWLCQNSQCEGWPTNRIMSRTDPGTSTHSLGRPSPRSNFVADDELGCHVKHLDNPTAEAQIDQRDISWRQALVEVLTCGVGRLYTADKPNGWRLDTFVGHGYRRVSQPILSRCRSVLSTVRCALLLGNFSPFCSWCRRLWSGDRDP